MPPVLSFTGKRWIIPEPTEASGDILQNLKESRGIRSSESIISPTVYPDITIICDRLRQAIERRETIGIFGDYDCDGITGAAILVRLLRRRGIEPIVILPHRVRDGYGLTTMMIERWKAHGISLLLTVDTGITAVDAIAEARRSGIDVLITDHHHLQEEVPAAFGILHPALAPGYPEPHPSGSGVAFALATALEGTATWEGRDTDIALAAIGMIADLVPLQGGNRALVQEGITALNALTDGPLALFADTIRSKNRALVATDIAFRLAPRINAAGRMEDPMIALTALLDGGPALQSLETLNGLRQSSTLSLLVETYTLLDLPENPSHEQLMSLPPLLAVAHASFPEGIIGLLAGRLTEAFGRPSLVATIRDGRCTASLRSIPAFHVAQGLKRCSDLLGSFGGHAQAAGCSFAEADFPLLRQRMSDDVAAHVSSEDLFPSLSIASSIQPQNITVGFCEGLAALEPFGQGNPEPLFLLPHVRLENCRQVGAEGAHLQCRVADIKAIGFRLGAFMAETMKPLDITCKLQVDTWNGYRNPQVVIEDMRVSKW
ncbi:MAG: DHH family phosphoesterase [Candidatus Peregrinibacteria bacterium]